MSTINILIFQWQSRGPERLTSQVAEPRCKPRQSASRPHTLVHGTVLLQGWEDQPQPAVKGMQGSVVSPVSQEQNCSCIEQDCGRIREPQQMGNPQHTCNSYNKEPSGSSHPANYMIYFSPLLLARTKVNTFTPCEL